MLAKYWAAWWYHPEAQPLRFVPAFEIPTEPVVNIDQMFIEFQSIPVQIPCSAVSGAETLAEAVDAPYRWFRRWLSVASLVCVPGCALYEPIALEEQLQVLENCTDNSLSLLLQVPSPKTPDVRLLKVEFGGAEMRPGIQDPSCEVEFLLDHKRKPRVSRISWNSSGQQRSVTPTHPAFSYGVELALSGCATLLTLREHLLVSHFLVTGGINALSNAHLPHHHPVWLLIHTHSHGIHYTNLGKGRPLLEALIQNDLCLTQKGFAQYTQHVVSTFDLEQLRIPCQTLAQLAWDKIRHYVERWLIVAYQTREHNLDQDPALQEWWSALQKYSYFTNFGIRPTWHQLHNLLSKFVWVSVYLHDMAGDQSEQVVLNSQPWMPLESSLVSRAQARSKVLTDLLFWITRLSPSTSLQDPRWIAALPARFQGAAFEFQKSMKDILPDLRLGTNK